MAGRFDIGKAGYNNIRTSGRADRLPLDDVRVKKVICVMFWFFLNLILLLVLFVSLNIFSAVFNVVAMISSATGWPDATILIGMCFVGIWASLMTMIEVENGYIFMLSLGIAIFYIWLANSYGAFGWIPSFFGG